MWPLAGCISSCIVRTPSPQLGVLQSIRGSSLSGSLPSPLLFHSPQLPLESHPRSRSSSRPPPHHNRPKSGIRRNLLTMDKQRQRASKPQLVHFHGKLILLMQVPTRGLLNRVSALSSDFFTFIKMMLLFSIYTSTKI